MKQLFFISLAAALLFGCTKQDFSHQGDICDSEANYSRSLTASGLKIAEDESGIVICTVDEDILQAAIVNYYGATEFKSLDIHEYNPGTTNSFYALTGRIKDGNAHRRFAFELVPFIALSGATELYVPYLGTEQNVTGPGNSASPLNLTSASTGSPASHKANYSSSQSFSSFDDFGTNRLITKILEGL
ncbi:MAG: hypothetical protein ACI837_002901 [Crocinitomicaceae bacterium]|jgi:hypothetical protein